MSRAAGVLASQGLEAVEHIHQLPEAAVITPVEAERDAFEIKAVVVFAFLGRRIDLLDRRADDDVESLR